MCVGRQSERNKRTQIICGNNKSEKKKKSYILIIIRKKYFQDRNYILYHVKSVNKLCEKIPKKKKQKRT